MGALHNRLGQMTVKYAAVTRRETCGGYTEDELAALARACKGFALPVTGVCGFDQAQVTAGGLCTDKFDPETIKKPPCLRPVCLRRAAGRGRRLRRVQPAVGLGLRTAGRAAAVI